MHLAKLAGGGSTTQNIVSITPPARGNDCEGGRDGRVSADQGRPHTAHAGAAARLLGRVEWLDVRWHGRLYLRPGLEPRADRAAPEVRAEWRAGECRLLRIGAVC